VRIGALVLSGSALLLLGAVGCGSGSAINTGPLGGGQVSGDNECMPTRPGQSKAAGEQFVNSGSTPAVIRSVTLWHASGTRLVSAWVMPLTDGDGDVAILGSSWPPPQGLVNWHITKRADGAVVPPGPKTPGVTDYWQVLLQLAGPGHVGAVTVRYTVGSTTYIMRQGESYTLKDGACGL
jgi:hypothetical protein